MGAEVSELFDPTAWRPVEGFTFTDITYHRAVDGGTVRIAFDRPEVRNAFRPGTVDELYRALDHARIRDLVVETGAGRLVVGLPISLDGSLGPAARGVLDEVEELGATIGVPVETYDERLSTVTAERLLREQGVKGPDRRAVVDKVAAAVILQAWLDGRPPT